MKEEKIFVGILATERNNFSWLFIDSLLRLQKYMGDKVIISCIHSGTIPDGRNAILDLAKNNNCDYALMIDSDMTFPPNGIEVLMSEMNKFEAEVACGIYFGTYPPFQSKPMAYDWIEGKQTALDKWNETRYIHSCGMGFTLIHKNLFHIKFEFRPNQGEDYLFCKQVKELESKIILVPDVRCGHLRTIALDETMVKLLYN